MTTRPSRLAFVLTTSLVACGASHPPPTASHTGWSLRYTQRAGDGPAPPRDVRPEVTIEVIDGIARITSPERGLITLLDGPHRRAQLCRASRCVGMAYDDALAATMGLEPSHGAAGATEDEPSAETLPDPMSIANVPTTGARFSGTVQSAGAAMRFTIEARWIEQPGEPSVDVARDYFVAPIVNAGATRLANLVRQTAGLPLHWEMRVSMRRADGSVTERAMVYRAAALDNPPAGLPTPQ